MEEVNILKKMIEQSDNIVFFGGAGVSTGSGIKDFRGKNGIYKEKFKYSPEYYLSSECFYNDVEDFFSFYKDKMNSLMAKPNIVHKYLKLLEDMGKLKGIITQNIDGLHQKAGSKKVYEIHGSIYRNYCLECDKEYDANYVFDSKGVPRCNCGGIIKPDVILYGEMLNDNYEKGIKLIKDANLLIVAGSSLTVEPASSMINFFNGKKLVIINDERTPYDYKADLIIRGDLINIFSLLK